MNTPHRKVIHRKEEYWQDKINHWKSSHLTQAKFCHQHGLAMSTFHKWQKKLRTEEIPEPQLPQPFIEPSFRTNKKTLKIKISKKT